MQWLETPEGYNLLQDSFVFARVIRDKSGYIPVVITESGKEQKSWPRGTCWEAQRWAYQRSKELNYLDEDAPSEIAA